MNEAFQNAYMALLLCILASRICQLEEGLTKMRMEIQIPLERRKKIKSFPNFYKLHNLYILIHFYLIFSCRVCPRSM
jgi:hypothetical protein